MMSLRNKKSSSSTLPKEKKSKQEMAHDDAKPAGKVTKNDICENKDKRCTPTRHILNSDKKKTKSSMKKIKKFLKSRSKKKSFSADSPSLEHMQPSKSESLRPRQIFEDSLSSVHNTETLNERPNTRKSLNRSSLANQKQVKRSLPTLPLAANGDERPEKRRRVTETVAASASTQVKPDVGFVEKTCSGVRRSLPSPGMLSPVVALDDRQIQNSTEEGAKLFAYMIEPVTPTKFFRDIWEKKPLLVRRHNPQHNEGWFSTQELDRIMREEQVHFTENIDVVTYMNGKRETHNPTGRAYAPVVWDHYQNGCSVRLLNPHAYSDTVWNALSLLQEYFSCVAGANVYLTPPGSQGFAPHWDDIEAFILQLEGKKHWRVYEPRNESEVLPSYSSPNFTDADLPSPPVLDTILEPGDLLYFPRGFIHQGETLEGTHSLHITVSVGQKNTWGDLLQKLVPRALELAIEEDVKFRRSLPKDYFNYMGVAFSDENTPERGKFVKTIERLLTKLLSSAPVDAACDQMAKDFMQNTLPPLLTEEEKQCSVHGTGERWDVLQNRVRCAVEIEPDTEIKIIRRGCLRLVMEEDKVYVYHNMQNARSLHGADVQCIEVEPRMAEAVEVLLKNYPNFIAVDDLPLDTVPERVELAAALYDRGLIMTREPMEPQSGDDTSDECCDSSASDESTENKD